ncbi:TMV resistance protein N-like [Pyrus ussuriensis x Pyrus communis]|uniref:TMV resistance protein N-like n=1 Tax=Pyrus ussuriensis x Pyrus communis TaxID=2448454 RepID=A0A5N5ICQ6_9ROSA|nr:TMV resistance protein N-like [Pyrus ussuriensis x Pyrus communis]
MGGIGKTTLAKAVVKKASSNFESCCFLTDVREKSEQTGGVDRLQETLLREILKEEHFSLESTSVRDRLSRTKPLIVFDDVNDPRQIKDLAGDHIQYGPGSRILITSRRQSVLMKTVKDNESIYQVGVLETDDALRLFHMHAFNNSSPRADYAKLSERVVDYAGGKEEWEDLLKKLKKYPNKDIQNAFKVSYDRLEENEQEIFLDIACCYKGEGAKWSFAFFELVTEVSVYFFPPSDRPDPVSGEPFVKVEKCGIHLLYSEEAEKLKFDVISRELQAEEEDEAEASGIDEPEATESDESEASGGAEFEEASESDECVAGLDLSNLFSTSI